MAEGFPKFNHLGLSQSQIFILQAQTFPGSSHPSSRHPVIQSAMDLPAGLLGGQFPTASCELLEIWRSQLQSVFVTRCISLFYLNARASMCLSPVLDKDSRKGHSSPHRFESDQDLSISAWLDTVGPMQRHQQQRLYQAMYFQIEFRWIKDD